MTHILAGKVVVLFCVTNDLSNSNHDIIFVVLPILILSILILVAIIVFCKLKYVSKKVPLKKDYEDSSKDNNFEMQGGTVSPCHVKQHGAPERTGD